MIIQFGQKNSWQNSGLFKGTPVGAYMPSRYRLERNRDRWDSSWTVPATSFERPLGEAAELAQSSTGRQWGELRSSQQWYFRCLYLPPRFTILPEYNFRTRSCTSGLSSGSTAWDRTYQLALDLDREIEDQRRVRASSSTHDAC